MAVSLLAVASCSEDRDYKPGGTTPVKGLLAPADNHYVELQSSSAAVLNFAWEPALAIDGQNPGYEVVILNRPGGEIVYRIDAGGATSVKVQHKVLNIAAKAAGIGAGESGDMYWTVVSNRGVETAPLGAAPKCISVTRLFGFDVIPASLYITGEATETATDLDAALQFQDVSPSEETGEYIVISRLETGKTYEICENTTGSGRRFTIEEGELREFGAEVKPGTRPAAVNKSGIYRVYVDFNTRSTIIEEVTRVAFYQRDNEGGAVALEYRGLGVWMLEAHETTAGDNRYGFVASISGATTYKEKWSSVNYDNNSPSAASPLSWWKVFMNKDIAADGWWGYSYKWITSDWAETKKVTIEMHMDHTQDFYYHTVKYIK